MSYFRVAFVVQGTTWGYVDASSPEEAAEKALQLEDKSLPLCWQCAHLVDGATTGSLELDTVDVVAEPKEIEEAKEFIEGGGW